MIALESLTKTQQEVLAAIASGKSRKEIADARHVSPKTVEYHAAQLMERLGVNNVAQLTHYAIATGLINVMYDVKQCQETITKTTEIVERPVTTNIKLTPEAEALLRRAEKPLKVVPLDASKSVGAWRSRKVVSDPNAKYLALGDPAL